MPIYDYKCSKCNTEFTCKVKFSEHEDLQPCEKCAEPTPRDRTPKATSSFSLKGSGWAKDNYGLKRPRR